VMRGPRGGVAAMDKKSVAALSMKMGALTENLASQHLHWSDQKDPPKWTPGPLEYWNVLELWILVAHLSGLLEVWSWEWDWSCFVCQLTGLSHL
jgi:hypothetical protein